MRWEWTEPPEVVELAIRIVRRLFVSDIALFAAALFVVLSATGKGGVLWVVVTLALFAAGWGLLPIIREWIYAGIAGVVVWVWLAFVLTRLGEESVRGWMVPPWIVATAALAICLYRAPPRYLRKGEGERTYGTDRDLSPEAYVE